MGTQLEIAIQTAMSGLATLTLVTVSIFVAAYAIRFVLLNRALLVNR